MRLSLGLLVSFVANQNSESFFRLRSQSVTDSRFDPDEHFLI